MAASSNIAATNSDLELLVTRVFAAPRSLLWQAWTEPAHLMHWWGPRGFSLVSCELDLRPGGFYHFRMLGAEGDEHRSQGVFREVIEPERLVLAGSWVDASGQPTGPHTVVTVTFEEKAPGETTMTLHHRGFDSASSRDAHRGGWGSSFERLGEHLENVRN